jgi:hypothetical protein
VKISISTGRKTTPQAGLQVSKTVLVKSENTPQVSKTVLGGPQKTVFPVSQVSNIPHTYRTTGSSQTSTTTSSSISELPRELKSDCAEPIQIVAYVWNVRVSGKNVRVVDPSRESQKEFEASMAQQLGEDRVGKCVRLWPEEKSDE